MLSPPSFPCALVLTYSARCNTLYRENLPYNDDKDGLRRLSLCVVIDAMGDAMGDQEAERSAERIGHNN